MIRTGAVAAMLSLAAVAPAPAQVLSIDSCQALARSNYPLIRQYELIEKTKEFTLSNASKAYLPQISVAAIEGYIVGDLPTAGGEGNSGGRLQFIGLAQLNQTIWDGGTTKAQKKVITASAETDKASLDVALYDLRSRVNQVYFGILLVEEQLVQLEAQNTILTNNANRILQLSDNGLAYKTDLDEIKVEQLRLNQQRIELRYVRRGYATMLSLLTGREIDEKVRLAKPALESPADLAIARPELSLFASQRSLVDAQSGVQRAGLMPKVGLLGAGVLLAPSIGIGQNGVGTIAVAGLSASWSIGGLYRHGNDKALTAESLRRIGLQEQTFLFNTNLQVAQTSANIEKQRAILAEDDAIVGLRSTIRESYQVRYAAGSSPLIELLNATERESEARSQRALHEMQLLIAIAEQRTQTGH
jgi:outer membrane protein TolC